MNRSVSVVIPTCGYHDYFLSCLESLRRQTFSPLEVILINNACCAELEQKVRSSYAAVKMITPEQNLFYGRALNRGIAVSTGDFILCLNDDVVLGKDFIAEAVKGFDRDEKIGMISGKILRPDRKTLDTTGLFLSTWRAAHERGYGREDWGQFESEGPIFGVSGAVAFYRKKMLDDIREGEAWFDPDFRMFYEDLDLAWRAQKRGWKGRYIPSAVAYHVRGGSVRSQNSQGKAFARRYLNDEMHSELIRNRYRAILKNETLMGFWVHLVPIVLYDLGAWCYIFFFRPKVIGMFFSKIKGVSGTAFK